MNIAELFFKGGFLMYPIVICSFAGVAIFINKLLQYRQILTDIKIPIEEISEKTNPFLKPVIEAVHNGKTERELSVIATKQVRKIEGGLSWLALISAITPLLGFTGTVTGMMNTFMAVSSYSSVNPSLLAAGIWEALITTAAGLLIAIPIHIGHHYLEKQADEIVFVLKEITMEIYRRHRDGN